MFAAHAFADPPRPFSARVGDAPLLPCNRTDEWPGHHTLEAAMLAPENPHPLVAIREREADSWPLAVALAVIGPFILAVALAVLAAVAG
jgi:hypothetical protein